MKFNLSKKMTTGDCYESLYFEEDVKEFIRLLKKKMFNMHMIHPDTGKRSMAMGCMLYEEELDKLAGDKLI